MSEIIITITAMIPIVGNCCAIVPNPADTLFSAASAVASVVVALNCAIVMIDAPATTLVFKIRTGAS